MLFIVMCKSVDFRTVSGDGGWQCVEACVGASFTSWHRLTEECQSSIWTLPRQIGSGLISRLIMIQAKLSVSSQEKMSSVC